MIFFLRSHTFFNFYFDFCFLFIFWLLYSFFIWTSLSYLEFLLIILYILLFYIYRGSPDSTNFAPPRNCTIAKIVLSGDCFSTKNIKCVSQISKVPFFTQLTYIKTWYLLQNSNIYWTWILVMDQYVPIFDH